MIKNADNNAGRDSIGRWADLAFEKAYGSAGSRYSLFDRLMHDNFKLAIEGDMPAIRLMVRALKANIRERKQQKEWIARNERPYYDTSDIDPRNADAALLLLGITAVDNDTVARFGSPDSSGYKTAMQNLRPTRIAHWAADLARELRRVPEPDDYRRGQIVKYTSSDDSNDVTSWYSQLERWIAEIVRLRGPGSTRFGPGQSGNSGGRPRKQPVHPFPYDDFLMALVTVKVNGRDETITRLDALMFRLMAIAQKGDKKIADLVSSLVMDVHEERWAEPRPAIIVRGDPWDEPHTATIVRG